MQRAIIALLIGFSTGAGAMYGLLREAGVSPDESLPITQANVRPSQDTPNELRQLVGPAAPAVADQARVYQSVALASIDDLRAMARDALQNIDVRGRAFELDVIIARLIELDPEEALELARDNDVDSARMINVAVSVMSRMGYSEAAFREVLAALPQLNEGEFRAAALEDLALTDPARALAIALADLDSRGPVSPAFFPYAGGTTQTLMRIVAIWADQDPDRALAAVDSIANVPARLMLAQAVLGRLAQSDPDAVLARVRAMDVPGPQKAGLVRSAIMQLAMRDPEEAARHAETLSGQDGQIALMMSVQQWAQQDVQAAIAYVEKMPVGMMRENLLQQVASTYGRNDPDAALAWARSPIAAQTKILAGVLAGIAQTDPLRALEFALDESPQGLTPPVRMEVLMSVIGSASSMASVSHRTLADRVLTIENTQARESALNILGQRWASTDVGGALTWFLDKQTSISSDVFRNLAQQIGRQDPQSAAIYLGRIPTELRDDWITAIAGGYAQADPVGARSWVLQFRGEPGFAAAVTEVIQYSAGVDPAGAASLWASMGLEDRSLDTHLVSTIAASWAAQDWTAARNWVATIPRGETRDEALAVMISTGSEALDTSLLSLFSDAGRRLGAIQNAIIQTAQYDPDRARRLAAEHFDDPSLRADVEQMIDDIQTRENRSGIILRGARRMVPATGFISDAPVVLR